MDFELTEEQALLSDSLERLLASHYSFEARQAAMATGEGFSRELWAQLADMGFLGLCFPEDLGGFGGAGVDLMMIMQAFGRRLVLEPFLSTVVLCGGMLAKGGSGEQAERVGQIIAGRHLMALAHSEPNGPRFTIGKLRTKATATDGGWRISGRKTAVLHGGSADELIVSAVMSEGQVGLFIIPAATRGVTITAREGYDGIRTADLTLDAVAVDGDQLVVSPDRGADLLRWTLEQACVAVTAEAVGVMDQILAMTLEYLRTRKQFGVPIGSFQALQHCAVDLMVALEQSRSMAILGAIAADQEGQWRSLNIAAAKCQIGRAGRLVGQKAVQLHGAIGLTSEYMVGHGFKRLTAIDALFGDADHHAAIVAAAGGLPPLGQVARA